MAPARDILYKATRAQAHDRAHTHARTRLHPRVSAHTQTKICNIYCFSMVTIVSQTRLNATLFLHCLSCLWIA